MIAKRGLWAIGLRIHRLGGAILIAFVILHLCNHLVALGGVEAHLNAMDALREIYRNPIAEAVLLTAALTQMLTGIYRVINGWRERSGFADWLQAVSGLYLAFFLVIHLSAVLTARANGVDTNFYFAAAGLHAPNWPWFFAPYYSLAVAAVIIHPACAAHWHLNARGNAKKAKLVLRSSIVIGLALGAIIVATLAGLTTSVVIPAEYIM